MSDQLNHKLVSSTSAIHTHVLTFIFGIIIVQDTLSFNFNILICRDFNMFSNLHFKLNSSFITFTFTDTSTAFTCYMSMWQLIFILEQTLQLLSDLTLQLKLGVFMSTSSLVFYSWTAFTSYSSYGNSTAFTTYTSTSISTAFICSMLPLRITLLILSAKGWH